VVTGATKHQQGDCCLAVMQLARQRQVTIYTCVQAVIAEEFL
jgi:hypothetical protein